MLLNSPFGIINVNKKISALKKEPRVETTGPYKTILYFKLLIIDARCIFGHVVIVGTTTI